MTRLKDFIQEKFNSQPGVIAVVLDRDILLQKVNSIQNCLKTIRKATEHKLENLNNQIVQDAVVLNIQRAVQLCVDMASYMINKLHWGLAASLRELFVILQQNEVIDEKLTEKMIKMVGFRNIALHEYQKLNLEILKKIIVDHLSDFDEFYEAVLKYCERVEK
ncbi:MAG: DUF86 domain-containing protein [Proteobacteria bacterium]|nr:DUF86 domain-containing protein [Pseudomonadota bacterium]